MTARVLVLGQMRTGTSAIMQMLDAAGFYCHGHPPLFEKIEITDIGGYHLDIVQPGQAGKALVAYHPPAHIPWDFKVIWTFRHLPELHKSMDKYVRDRVSPLILADPAAIANDLERVHKEIYASLQERKVIYLGLSFEDMMRDPHRTARKVAEFTGTGNPDVMAKQIVTRGAECYPGFLEDALGSRKRITELQR